MFIDFVLHNDTATSEFYTLSLHDALPISVAVVITPTARGRPPARSGPSVRGPRRPRRWCGGTRRPRGRGRVRRGRRVPRSEEHTSELQSLAYLVCRLLLEKKKKKTK